MPKRWCNPATLAWLALGAIAMAAPANPAASEATKTFNAQYGDELARVTASHDVADDLALAAEFLAAAQAPDTRPALLPLLCEKAYDLTAKQAEGYRTAIKAMTLLAAAAPEKKEACEDKVLDVYQTHYAKSRGAGKVKAGEALVATIIRYAEARTADTDFAGAVRLYRRAMPLAATLRSVNHTNLKAKLDYATTRQGFRAQAGKLEAFLKEDPNDKAARDELVRIYVVEFDDPAAAARQLDLKADTMAAKYVLLAGMSIERLPQRALAELGHWYRSLAEESSAQGRLIALTRAKTFYERYLRTNTPAGGQRDEVAAGLNEVDNVLAKAATVMPKITVLDDAPFNARYGNRFQPSGNFGAHGAAHASSHWGNRLPQYVLRGNRSGNSWTLNGPKGWFLAKWDPPARGRYILVIARDGKPGSDAWGNATVAVNGNRPAKIEGMSSGRSMVVDLGLDVPITSLRLTISGTTYPGIAGIEIHAETPLTAAPEAPTPPSATVE